MTISASYPGALPRNTVRRRTWNFPLYVNAGFRLEPETEHTVLIIRPNGTTCGGIAPIASGEVHLPNQSMLEGQWVAYLVQQGDLTILGTYTVQLGATPPYKMSPPQATFQVIP